MKKLLTLFYFAILFFGFSLSADTDRLRINTSTYDLTFDYLKEPNEQSLSKVFLQKLVNIFATTIFIEAGFSIGKNSLQASQYFNQIHAISPKEDLFKKAKSDLKDQKNIIVHLDDTGKTLESLLSKLTGRVLLYFDYLNYSQKDPNCAKYLLRDLKSIKEAGLKDSVILIDGMRFWGKSQQINENLDYYASLNSLRTTLLEINHDYDVIFMGDALLAYPKSNIRVSPILRGCTESRFYDGTNLDPSSILHWERVLANPTIWDPTIEGTETRTLEFLIDSFGNDDMIYKLWGALIYMEKAEYLNAYNQLKYMHDYGFTNWRIKFYLAQAAYGAGLKKEGDFFTKENKSFLEKNVVAVTEIKSGSKIAIMGAHDKNYDHIGKYAHLNKLAYAKKHGYGVILYTGEVDPIRPPYWYKITAVQRYLDEFDWIFWLDSDALIMNYNIKLETLIDDNYDFILVRDCVSLASGGWLIKNSEWSKKLLRDWYSLDNIHIAPGFDNAALIKLYNDCADVRNHFKVMPQKTFGSYPVSVCPTGKYEEGDMVIHFAGVSHSNKEAAVKEYYEKARTGLSK